MSLTTPRALDPTAAFSPGRVGALVLRNLYLLRASWPRLLELIYWPTVQMLMWGFMQSFVSRNTTAPVLVGGAFIGAVLLWDVLIRGQLGFSVTFLEEMYARNMGNLLMSPLRVPEFLAALATMSLIRLAISMVPVTILAVLFFGFNLYALGLGLAAFFALLILTSWSIGLVVSGLVLRNGMGAEGLAWSITFVLLPFTCVYYPVSTLPSYLHPVAWALPPTYVFEGMRSLVIDHVFRADLMLEALGLALVYLAAGCAGFLALLRSARERGSLLQMGE